MFKKSDFRGSRGEQRNKKRKKWDHKPFKRPKDDKGNSNQRFDWNNQNNQNDGLN
jgi:hypothetical protein